MIDLEIDKPNHLQFQVDIAGDKQHVEPRIDFRIVTESLTLSFPAIKNGSNHEVEIPILEKYLGPGTYRAEISVVLGDRYFVPLEEQVTVIPKIETKISTFVVKDIEVKPRIHVEAVKPSPKPEPIVEVTTPIVFKRTKIVKEQ